MVFFLVFVGSVQIMLDKLENGRATRRTGCIESWHVVQDR